MSPYSELREEGSHCQDKEAQMHLSLTQFSPDLCSTTKLPWGLCWCHTQRLRRFTGHHQIRAAMESRRHWSQSWLRHSWTDENMRQKITVSHTQNQCPETSSLAPSARVITDIPLSKWVLLLCETCICTGDNELGLPTLHIPLFEMTAQVPFSYWGLSNALSQRLP